MDIVPFLFVQDAESVKHMELSAAIWIDPLKILQPWPEEESRLKVRLDYFNCQFVNTFSVRVISGITNFFFWRRFGYAF